jgi:hypothetical protein
LIDAAGATRPDGLKTIGLRKAVCEAVNDLLEIKMRGHGRTFMPAAEIAQDVQRRYVPVVRVETPAPPPEYLLATRDVVAFRVRGRPRDVETGQHRAVVIFAGPGLTPARLAGYLREAAQALHPAE